MSFERYPKYKPSGVEWLGDIPESWVVRRIKHVGNTITGGTPKTEEQEYWIDGDVPWLPSGKVQNNSIHRDDADTFITRRALAESAAKLIRPGSALIALTGATCANVAFLTFESTANQSVVGIEPKLIADGRFIYFALLSQREQVLTYKSGGAQGGINQEDVRNIVITVPEKAEQAAIAEFLDRETGKIDGLVAEQRRLTALLKEKRQAVISRAVTKGLNPHAPMKPSGIEWLGDVPSHWKVIPIKWLSPVKRGASPRPIDDPRYFDEEGEYAWVRIADVSACDGVLSETTQRLSPLGSSLSVKILPNELFVSIAGTVGKPCIAAIKACIHDGFVYFPTLKINPWFLYRIFEAGDCYGGLGKWGTQLNLNTDTVGSIRIAIPPADELHQILKFIDDESSRFDTLTAEAQRAIDLLQERRTALISAAVTGQIDVCQQARN